MSGMAVFYTMLILLGAIGAFLFYIIISSQKHKDEE